MRNLIFLGPPGCGKGTQASLISSKLNYIQLSTGELLRKISKEDSNLGRKIASELSKGNFIDDEMVNELINNFYSKCGETPQVILDGYPRNVNQAIELNKTLSFYHESVTKVFYFKVRDDILIKRITGRYTCSSCGATYNSFFCPTQENDTCDICKGHDFIKRSDDNEQVIKNRLEIYKNHTTPLLEYYKDKLVEINAELSAEEVFKQIVVHL